MKLKFPLSLIYTNFMTLVCIFCSGLLESHFFSKKASYPLAETTWSIKRVYYSSNERVKCRLPKITWFSPAKTEASKLQHLRCWEGKSGMLLQGLRGQMRGWGKHWFAWWEKSPLAVQTEGGERVGAEGGTEVESPEVHHLPAEWGRPSGESRCHVLLGQMF